MQILENGFSNPNTGHVKPGDVGLAALYYERGQTTTVWLWQVKSLTWLQYISSGGGGGLTQAQISSTFSLTAGVKVYRALLTQTATAAPVATVLENTLEGTVVWSRVEGGNYPATLAGGFTSGKTFLLVNAVYEVAPVFFRVDSDTVVLLVSGDDLLTPNGAFVEILVYP